MTSAILSQQGLSRQERICYKVQKLLGHKTPIMTQRYAYHYPESLRDAVEVLDEIREASDTKIAHLEKDEQLYQSKSLT